MASSGWFNALHIWASEIHAIGSFHSDAISNGVASRHVEISLVRRHTCTRTVANWISSGAKLYASIMHLFISGKMGDFIGINLRNLETILGDFGSSS